MWLGNRWPISPPPPPPPCENTSKMHCHHVQLLFYVTEGPLQFGVYNSLVLWAPNSTRLSARAISQGPQNSRFPAPTPPPPPPDLPTQSICPHQKPYSRGRINHRCINSQFRRAIFNGEYKKFSAPLGIIKTWSVNAGYCAGTNQNRPKFQRLGASF